MKTETVYSRIELEKEIECALSDLAKSSLRSSSLPIDIENLIGSISELSGIILERCEFIEDVNSSENAITHIRHIERTISRIQTICEATCRMIEVDDYMIIQTLMFLRSQLDKLDASEASIQ